MSQTVPPQVEQIEVFHVVTNSDLTEGRGRSVVIGYSTLRATALRLAHKKGVQGTDAEVCKTIVYKINGALHGPILLTPPTQEDIKAQSNADIRARALEKAKAAGLTDEDIAIITRTHP